MQRSETSQTKHPDVMYEARDVNAKVIAWVVLGIFLSMALILISVKWTYGYFTRSEFRGEQPVTLVRQTRMATPGPLLQVNPTADLQQLRESEERLLNSYGWVDQKKGLVRIPIEEAMRLAVEKGLPAAEKPVPSPVPSVTVVTK